MQPRTQSLQGPVIALEFWDAQDELVVAHFGPDGEVDAVTADTDDNMSSVPESLSAIRGLAQAQVSICLDVENGRYRAVGMIDAPVGTSIDDYIVECLRNSQSAYDNLRGTLPEWARSENPILH